MPLSATREFALRLFQCASREGSIVECHLDINHPDLAHEAFPCLTNALETNIILGGGDDGEVLFFSCGQDLMGLAIAVGMMIGKIPTTNHIKFEIGECSLELSQDAQYRKRHKPVFRRAKPFWPA